MKNITILVNILAIIFFIILVIVLYKMIIKSSNSELKGPIIKWEPAALLAVLAAIIAVLEATKGDPAIVVVITWCFNAIIWLWNAIISFMMT